MEYINRVPKEITLENPYAPKDPLHYASKIPKHGAEALSKNEPSLKPLDILLGLE